MSAWQMRSQSKATFSGVLQKKKKKKGPHLSGVKFGGTCSNTIGVRGHIQIF